MNIFHQLAAVRAAHLRVALAHCELDGATGVLLARSAAHPLTTVGVAATAGVVLGSLNVRPLRVPGLGALLSGGLADTAAFAMRLFTEFGVASLGVMAGNSVERHPDTTGAPADSASS